MGASPSPRNRTLPALLTVAGGLALLCFGLVVVAGLGGFWLYQRGQDTATLPAVEYVLDASPRMETPAEGGTRLSVAQAILSEVVRPSSTSALAGLRVFGSGAVADPCQDTALLVPLAQTNQGQIADGISAVSAGTSDGSALAQAMIAAIRDLSRTQGPHTLVVVTGGADSCSPQAGELIRQEADRSGINLQMFVVGYDVDAEEAEAIKGMVEEITGTYLAAPDEETLRHLLAVIQAYVDQPTSSSLAAIQSVATSDTVTSEPTATVETEPVPSAIPTLVQPTAAASVSTACDHPYYPLRLGATWTFSTTKGELTETVESLTGDLANANAILAVNDSGHLWKEAFACSPDGILELWDADYTYSDTSGVSLPSLEAIVPGAAWSSAITYTDPTGTTTDSSATFTAGEPQTISTPAGSFDVIVIALNQVTTGTGPNGEDSTGEGTQYFALGVGIVRFEYVYDGFFSYSGELTSYDVP